MKAMVVDRKRILSAWEGRISGCQLGKAVEILSMLKGRDALVAYLGKHDALPLRDYVPPGDDPLVNLMGISSCRGNIRRSEPDDDINYSVLALMMLEEHGLDLTTAKVAGAWLRMLPAGFTFTAERAAYHTLLGIVDDTAVILGVPPELDLSDCAQNEWSEWIGAQIRADIYGWVCPGQPGLAADLARRDASLSHRGDGIHGAVFIAALGAAIPASQSMRDAIDVALLEIPKESGATEAVAFGCSLYGKDDAVYQLHERYRGLSPVHTVNNLALVVWGLLSGEGDFSAAIGDAVTAGLDTDCNGATIGGLWGLTGRPIPDHWTRPWQGRVAVHLAGIGELIVDDLVERTVAVAHKIFQDTQ
jgi:ADP-ribosylglycohydrolase